MKLIDAVLGRPRWSLSVSGWLDTQHFSRKIDYDRAVRLIIGSGIGRPWDRICTYYRREGGLLSWVIDRLEKLKRI